MLMRPILEGKKIKSILFWMEYNGGQKCLCKLWSSSMYVSIQG